MQGVGEYDAEFGQQRRQLLSSEAIGRAVAVQACAPQRFVGVDIAHARHRRLVEQRPLDRGVPSTGVPDPAFVVEMLIQWIPADMRNAGWHRRRAVVDQMIEVLPAERALIDESQLRATIGEAKACTQMRSGLGVRRDDKQLTAHPEMQDQSIRAAVQRQPQIFSATLGAGDRAARQPSGQVGCTRKVPPHTAGMQQLDIVDRPADDPSRQP